MFCFFLAHPPPPCQVDWEGSPQDHCGEDVLSRSHPFATREKKILSVKRHSDKHTERATMCRCVGSVSARVGLALHATARAGVRPRHPCGAWAAGRFGECGLPAVWGCPLSRCQRWVKAPFTTVPRFSSCCGAPWVRGKGRERKTQMTIFSRSAVASTQCLPISGCWMALATSSCSTTGSQVCRGSSSSSKTIRSRFLTPWMSIRTASVRLAAVTPCSSAGPGGLAFPGSLLSVIWLRVA